MLTSECMRIKQHVNQGKKLGTVSNNSPFIIVGGIIKKNEY